MGFINQHSQKMGHHPIPGTLPPTLSADRHHVRGTAARCDAAALRGADDGGGDGKRILGRGADGNEGDAAWPKRISGRDFHGILGIQFVNGWWKYVYIYIHILGDWILGMICIIYHILYSSMTVGWWLLGAYTIQYIWDYNITYEMGNPFITNQHFMGQRAFEHGPIFSAWAIHISADGKKGLGLILAYLGLGTKPWEYLLTNQFLMG